MLTRTAYITVLAAIVAALAGCKSPSALTADATGCRVTDIEIVDSAYKRDGVTTAWCARCNEKTFQCVTNAARDRVECREPAPEANPCL